MRTRLLIIIATFLVLIPWVRGLEFSVNNQVMVDGITTSAITVMIITVAFSLVSWFLFSWASKNIKFIGVPLSIITASSLIIPFSQTLGPMAAVIVGIVAGFVSFMLQKKMTCPTQNKSLILSAITLIFACVVLILIILAVQADSMEKGIGIGQWTGTAEGMEKTGFASIVNSSIEFIFFLVIIPSLMVTGLLVQGKTIKSKFLMVIGIALMLEGFSAIVYSIFFLFHSTDPSMMRPIEGIEYALFMHRQAFLLSGIIGIFVTVAGIIFWRKRK